jgi:hypothetical protein
VSRLAEGRRVTKERLVADTVAREKVQALSILATSSRVSSGIDGLGGWGARTCAIGKGTASSRSAQWEKDDRAIHTLRIVLAESGRVLPSKR